MNSSLNALIRIFVIGGIVILPSYWGYNSYQAGLEEARSRREAERRARVLDSNAANMFAARIEASDVEFVSNTIEKCTSLAGGSSSFYVTTDYRDPSEVERLLDNLHPYDVEAKIQYLGLPEYSHDDFAVLIGKVALEKFKRKGRMELEYSVTYSVDTFGGLKSAWAILTCPINMGVPKAPKLDNLYIE